MDQSLSHEQLVERIYNGEVMDLDTPGLGNAARELFRPLVEQMRGKEILYRCRVPWLVRVEQLSVDDSGFEAKATPIQEIRDCMVGMDMEHPLTFSATWGGLRFIGKAIGLYMLTDHFYVDQDVVAEVKAAAARSAAPKEISGILRRAMER